MSAKSLVLRQLADHPCLRAKRGESRDGRYGIFFFFFHRKVDGSQISPVISLLAQFSDWLPPSTMPNFSHRDWSTQRLREGCSGHTDLAPLAFLFAFHPVDVHLMVKIFLNQSQNVPKNCALKKEHFYNNWRSGPCTSYPINLALEKERLHSYIKKENN